MVVVAVLADVVLDVNDVDLRLLVKEVEFGWAVLCKVTVMSNPTQLILVEIVLGLSWGCGNIISIGRITQGTNPLHGSIPKPPPETGPKEEVFLFR